MLFDTHTHVQFEQYDADRDAVLARAREGNTWMVNVGTDPDSSQKAIMLAHEFGEGVFASVGLHPNDVVSGLNFALLEGLAKDEKVVGIGETGLDYFRTPEPEKQRLQKEHFLKHVRLARELDKALIIHCRAAHADMAELLKKHARGIRGVMHFFTGTPEDARAYLELGMYLSFSGVITFARDYDEAVGLAPLDRILVETDAPFATPAPFRGKRNEPFFVRHTAEKLAELKGVSFDEIAEATTRNARMLFRV